MSCLAENILKKQICLIFDEIAHGAIGIYRLGASKFGTFVNHIEDGSIKGCHIVRHIVFEVNQAFIHYFNHQ